MLALHSTTACAFNNNLLQQAVASTIVGFDKRAAREAFSAPLRSVRKAAERAANAVTMVASDEGKSTASSLTAFHQGIGDYGFDPLGLGNEETFVPFREAEIKHGRLAMLAAVAWPLQEIFHPILVDVLRGNGVNARDMLDETSGFSPSLLNGGLEQWEIVPSLSLAVYMASVLELKDIKAREAQGLKFNEYSKESLPGDLRFDPLRITRDLPTEEKVEFLEKELLNGRLAMIAVACYVAEETAFNTPVVRYTPDLFQPLILANDFRAFMDSAFGMASMDGSINGIA